ncbi:Protein CBG12623 [Caenorhabditis briggsae]|uniref:Protein CBG12623 n=1 Tax=Caenorhabditis briggsae TaxID=6238 RepID=A8XG65_CAEBR|nr:Protein CBG12623 [Caenorhabditis briggsae]CAP31571.1 Protein CBG12623 [Caenorhabditis briggsae]
MIRKVTVVLLYLVVVNAVDFGSDFSSCEDSYEGGGSGGNGVFARTNIEYTDAASACSNVDAVLSGIQNSEEKDYLARSASSNLASSTGSLWIGAKRTAACARSKLTATCSKTTSFYWTDGVTTGTAGFSWLDGSQPDNALGGNQDCLSFFFAPSKTVIARVNWFPGAMDDVNCDASQFNSILQRRIQGYVCGKAATS